MLACLAALAGCGRGPPGAADPADVSAEFMKRSWSTSFDVGLSGSTSEFREDATCRADFRIHPLRGVSKFAFHSLCRALLLTHYVAPSECVRCIYHNHSSMQHSCNTCVSGNTTIRRPKFCVQFPHCRCTVLRCYIAIHASAYLPALVLVHHVAADAAPEDLAQQAQQQEEHAAVVPAQDVRQLRRVHEHVVNHPEAQWE
jgi:hypothetical protein